MPHFWATSGKSVGAMVHQAVISGHVDHLSLCGPWLTTWSRSLGQKHGTKAIIKDRIKILAGYLNSIRLGN